MGPLGHWMVENGGEMFRQAIADYDEARGFMHGVFLRYYSTLPAFAPSDAELDLAFGVLSNVLLPDEPFAPYLETEYWKDVDPTRSSGPFSYTTKGDHWLRAGNITRRVYSRLIWLQQLPQVVAGICDKDEILPIEKLDRTRNFVPPPCWLHFCERLVFGPIADWESTQFENRPIKVGQNIHGGAVHEMFRKHRGRLTFQCDLSAQEYCYRLFVWRFLARLRAAASTVPDVVRVLYEAIVDAFLHHPDGHVYGPTLKNKSGRTLTLHDNGVQVLLLFFLAWARIRLRDGGDPNLFWTEVGDYLDIYGDNIIVSLDADFVNQYGIESFVAEMWSLGFVLKVEGQALSGHGLTWCGMIYESPSRPLVFAKPMKEVAKLVFSKLQPGMLAQQISGLYLMCYFTPIRPLLAKAADWLETAYGVEVHLFSRQEALQHWGPPTKQCSNPGGELLISMIKFPSENSQSFPFFPQNEFPETCGIMPRKPKYSSVEARKHYPKRPPGDARVVREVAKQVAKKEARPRKAKRTARVPRGLGGMSSRAVAAPTAVSFEYRSKFARKHIPGGCIVRMTDLVMPVQAGVYEQVQSAPFSLDLNDYINSNPNGLSPKLRMESTLWTRYQVLRARAMYKPKVGTGISGAVALALVTGEVKPPTSARELSLFRGAVYGNVWSEHATGEYRPRENVLYPTDRGGPDAVQQQFPFTVSVCVEGGPSSDVTDSSNRLIVGEVFIDVELRFQDEAAPPSNALAVSNWDAIASGAGYALQWKVLSQMMGDFNWRPSGVKFAAFAPIAVPDCVVGTVKTGANSNWPAGWFFDLEAGSYEIFVTVPFAAPEPEAKVDGGRWIVPSSFKADPGVNAVGDAYVSLWAQDLTAPSEALTCRAVDSYTVPTAATATFRLNTVLTVPSRCYTYLTHNAARVVNAFTRLSIIRRVSQGN